MTAIERLEELLQKKDEEIRELQSKIESRVKSCINCSVDNCTMSFSGEVCPSYRPRWLEEIRFRGRNIFEWAEKAGAEQK